MISKWCPLTINEQWKYNAKFERIFFSLDRKSVHLNVVVFIICVPSVVYALYRNGFTGFLTRGCLDRRAIHNTHSIWHIVYSFIDILLLFLLLFCFVSFIFHIVLVHVHLSLNTFSQLLSSVLFESLCRFCCVLQ